MICFMLDAAGQEAGCLLCLLLAVNILVPDDDMGIPFYLAEEFRNRKASFRVRIHFITIRFPFRIDIGLKARYPVICHKNALGNSNLRGCKAYAIGFIERLFISFTRNFKLLSKVSTGCAFIFKIGFPAVIIVLKTFPSFYKNT